MIMFCFCNFPLVTFALLKYEIETTEFYSLVDFETTKEKLELSVIGQPETAYVIWLDD